MSELITPTLIFDIDLNESLEFIDIDPGQFTICLKDSQLSDEVIEDTTVEFKSGRGPKIESELGYAYAETIYRKIIVYLGTYALSYNPDHSQSYESLNRSSLEATVALSRDLAHEAEHLRQYEEGTLPLVPLHETKLPWGERPWEMAAVAVEDEYIKMVNRRQRKLFTAVMFKRP